jgi:hypothetical protein
VQDLLEPQFVDLVNDDEKQLVMLLGQRHLTGQQLVKVQVASVGKVRRRAHSSSLVTIQLHIEHPCKSAARSDPDRKSSS